MEPGEVLVEEDPADVAAQVAADPDHSPRVLYETAAGGGAEGWRRAQGRFRATVAALAAKLGPPTETPTRRRGLPAPPTYLDPAWVEAAVWRLDDRIVTATISGGARKSCAVEISQEARS